MTPRTAPIVITTLDDAATHLAKLAYKAHAIKNAAAVSPAAARTNA